jgi:gliding motility-associated-like protein
MRKFLLFVSFIVLSVSVFAQVPTITSFSPVSVFAGANVTVLGTNLPSSQANCSVFIDGLNAEVLSSSVTQVVFKAPKGKAYGAILIVDKSSRLSGQSTATLVIKNGISGSVSNNILSNTTLAQGQSTIFSSAISSSSARNFDISDLNNDGRVEILASNAHDQLNVFSTNPGNDAVFNFTKQSFVNTTIRDGFGNQVTKALDFTGDGYTDILSNIPANSSGVLFPNSGSSTINFLTPVTLATTATWKYNGYNSSFGDLNKDGKPDFIGAYWLSNISIMGINTSTGGVFSHAIGSSNFNSSYSGNVTLVNGAANATTASDFGIADFNGDGFSDYIVSSSASTFVVLNTTTTVGSSSTSFSQSSDFGFGANNIRMADIDNDGDIDVLVQKDNTNLRVLTNNGSGSFTASTVSLNSSGVQLADYDGDGLLDIISYTGSVLNFHKNTSSSSISFDSNPVTIISNQGTSGLTGEFLITDLNSDGKYDVVTASGGTLYVFSAYTPPSLSVSGTLSAFSKCSSSSASNSQQFNISGSNLTANISVAALTGYEYSTDGNTWANTLSLTQSSGTVSSTVYVRMTAASTGSPSGNIALSSTGATSVNVAVSGSVGTNNVFIGALSFDGVNDKVTVADNNALDLTNNYTMEAWIYPRAFPWLGGIISKYHSNSSNGYHLRLSHAGNSRGLSFDEMITADNILTANTWYHVAAVNNNGTRKLYVNGVEVALTGTPTTVIANSDPLIIGRDFDGGNAGRFFNGDIDEVRLWNFAKTQAQVVAQKDISLTGSESNLVLYYNFNQGTPGGNNTSITTVSNLASGSYTGTLNGFDRTSTSSNFVASTNAPVIGGGSSLCLGSPLQLTHSVSGGTWSIPATTGLAISNSGVLTGTTSTTATSVVVSYLYTYNGCEYTDTKSITIGQQLAVGTATGNQTLCSSAAASAITLAGNTSGSTIQWQSSPDNATFSNISNATAASLSPGSLTSTTYYRAAVTTAACGTLYSNVITKGYNNSLNFDGTDDYVEAGAPLPIAANDNFTYEAWVRPTLVDANYRGFLGTSVLNVGRAPSMWVGPNGSLHTDSYNGSTRYDMLVDNFFIANTWVHVAWVKNGTTYTIYKNGVQAATATAPSSVLLPNANFTIGKLDNFFAGTLDEVRIWNTARTAQEITDNMSATLNGNETGLRAYYTFNQGTPDGTNTSINTVANLTATANLNGTLTAFAKTGTTSNFVGGFRAVIATQPVAPTAVCLNASSNTISVTAYGSGITYQWYTNTANSTTGATAITNATTNTYEVPTNVAGTKFYYVVVTGACSSAITSNIVSQVINSSTFSTEPSSAAQNIAYGGTATALTVASSGATAYQWYSTPTKPSLVSGFSGGTGWTSSTGSFQTFALYSGANPAIDTDGYLRFAYTSPSSIYRDFNLDQAATTISFSAQYASLDNNNDRGKIQLYFYNVSNTQVGSVSQSADLTGSNAWQSTALTNVAIPAGATKVRVVFYQIQEYPYWAGNYGIAFRNPSVTTNVALNGTAITGATSATYTPSTSTPGALYYYAVATGGCSTATSALSGLITIGKATPTIASMAAINKTFGDAAFTLTAPTSNATGAFTFASSNTAVATISGTTVTIVGAGTATITATQATDANYNAGSVTALLTVAKATPTIGSMSAISKTVGDAAFTLSAPSSNSTGAITYTSSNTSVATVSGSTVTIVGAGTATITATQATSNNYNAGSVTTTLTVAKAARTLSSFADINKTTTDAPFTLIAPVSSAGTGAFTYSSSNTAVATVSGSTVTIVGIGTATITATQAADANYLGATISATLTVVLGDSDGDGVPDDVEIRDGTDPNNPSSVKDSDGDGVPDYVEIGSGTNPNSPADAIDSDGDGLSDYYEARNAAPTNIILSATTVNENNTAGTAIVDLAATDVNIGEVFTYTLVSGTGDAENTSFTISGSSLRAVNGFDFETKTTYSLRLKVTDKGGLSFEKEFTITVADVNEAPTALALSNTSVLENAASGTTVGTLAGTDADAGDSHTYSLVTGTGSTDNASFTITGTTLSTAAVFNFEAKNSYAVRVRVTDAGGLSFERAFTISVTDVNEAPTLTAITDRRVYNVSTSQVVNLAGITAGPETAQSTTTSVSTDRPATFSSISVVGTQIQFTLAAGIVTPQDVVVTVRVRDNGGVANGGVDSVVRTFRLGIDPMPVAAASPTLITLGATAQLSATGANAVNYTWVAVGGSGIVGSGANINVRPRGTTTYAVVVTNSFGYQATVPVLLTVIVDYKLVPNNLVTPNGDGVNDRWVIPNIDMYPENEVMVYDKAGRAVFAKRGYNNEWDGTVNGKLLKEDAYFYVIKFNKDGALPIRGYVSIVR